MSIVLGSFSAVLGLDNTSYSRGILESQALTEVFGQRFVTFVTNPVLGGIQLLGDLGSTAVNMGKAMLESSRSILATASEVERLHQQTGLAKDTIQALLAELELMGKRDQGIDLLNEMVLKLGEAKNEGGGIEEAFTRAGISARVFAGDSEAAFRQVIDAIAALDTEADRLNLADLLFAGESFLLTTVLRDGSRGLDEIIAKQTKLGAVLEDDGVAKLAEMNRQMKLLQAGARGITDEFVEQVLLKIAGETELTEETIVNAVENIRTVIIPFGEEIGRQAADVLGNLDQLLDRVADMNVSLAQTRAIVSGVSAGTGALLDAAGEKIRDAAEFGARRRGIDPELTFNPRPAK